MNLKFLILLGSLFCHGESLNFTTINNRELSQKIATCYRDSECHEPHTVCVDTQCQCQPDYRPNITGGCEKFSCKDSNECRAYDQNRYCSEGVCICDGKMLVPDLTNGGKCGPTKCSTKTDCSDQNSVCLDRKCICAPNYSYNNSTQKCEHYKCENTSQCVIPYDHKRICQSGQCVCNDSKPDVSNGGKCVEASDTYLKFCDPSWQDCDWAETCVNSSCRCFPNFKYNQYLERCMKFECSETLKCTDYDPHRVCYKGKACRCEQNYVQDEENGNLCTKRSDTYGKHCSAQSDCHEVNQRCIDKVCRCQPNYWWTPTSQKCKYFDCSQILSHRCTTPDDSHLECLKFSNQSGSHYECACQPPYKQDPFNGNKCVLSSPISATSTMEPPTTVISSTTTTYYHYSLYYIIPISFFTGHVANSLN